MKSNKNKKLDTLIPMTILVLTLFFIVYAMYFKYRQYNIVYDTPTEINIVTLDNVDTPETTDEIYEELKTACRKYINSNDISVSSVDTSVVITENTYIDSNGNTIKSNEDDTMHETGPIYLYNKLLVRYINEKGEMKVVASKYDNNEIKTVDIANLGEILNNYDYLLQSLTSEGINAESKYINDICNIFMEVIKNPSINIDERTKNKAMYYFTLDGYNTIIEGAEYIENAEDNTKIVLVEAGKSNLDSLAND
ncbi:MAG: hypothetical protein J6A59_11745, partial [Lachnospiraceae bacterium]|nr:hypothetical protein [Lachnospiraceae bacterium]